MKEEINKKADVLKEQMEDRALIAKGKAQLATHQAEYQATDMVSDFKNKTESVIKTAKEKGSEIINSAREQAQESVDRTRKKAIDMLELAKQKLESSAQPENRV